MTEGRVERRLTTILAADVVGYNHVMAASLEAGTLASNEAVGELVSKERPDGATVQ